MPKKWEYKGLTLAFDTEAETELNALGDEGWELVTAALDPDWIEVQVVLKREKA